MNYRIVLVLIFALFTSTSVNSQIRFSETIQTSKIADSDANALYFVEFWATWCGPCVYATEYLEILQKQYPEQFYVVSISEENPERVRRHLKKHPTELAVSIDYNGETFNENKVRVLPYGILINAQGRVLWKGSPTDFKSTDLKKYLKQNTNKAAFEKVFKTESTEENEVEADYIPTENFEIKAHDKKVFETLEVNSKHGFTEYNGSLSGILAKELQVLENQIIINKNLDKNYQIYFNDNVELVPSILSALNLELSNSELEGDVLIIDNSDEKFWDTNQIDWGKDTARYLIDDNQIQADNVSFKDVLFQLSTILDLPIVTTNTVDETKEHDWMIHHKFFSLMQSDVLDNYGLKVEKQQASFKAYTITKKTP